MKRIGLLVLSLSAIAAVAQNKPATGVSSQTTLYITHANVVNVVNSRIDADQAIIIENDRITAVGPAKKVKAPANATIIDAAGKYVMPGMTDAHIHFFQSGSLYTRPDGLNLSSVYAYEKDQQWIKDNRADLMARYLACGITTVIDVGGPMSNFAVRDSVNRAIAAPTAYVTGPLISTYLPPNLDKKDPPIIKVTTEEEARELVRKQLPYKPDFIKIWYIVLPGQKAATTLPIVKATIEESHTHGLKVAVHATEYETAKLAVTAGADILVHSIDDKPLDNEMLQLLKTRNITYIPTLIVAQNYDRTFTQQFNYSSYELSHANPFMLGTLTDLQHIAPKKVPFDYKKIRTRLSVPSKMDSTMLSNVKIVQQAGIRIVAGTDAGNIGTQHASSFLTELLTMQQAGLTNWEIIRSATLQPAKAFGKDSVFGSIEKGKVADLLLLKENPVLQLSALANIDTVFHRGVPMNAQALLPVTPEILVQQQLNAYNARNIDAFVAPYSDSVKLYNAAGKVVQEGKQTMLKQYGAMFNRITNLHCELVNRIVQDNIVIDHEKVIGFGDAAAYGIAIYTIEKGKIVKVQFLP